MLISAVKAYTLSVSTRYQSGDATSVLVVSSCKFLQSITDNSAQTQKRKAKVYCEVFGLE